MKKFLHSKFGKQLLVGLPMILLAVLLGFVLEPLHQKHEVESFGWFIWCVAVLGTGLSGFFTCLCGLWGLCLGYLFTLTKAALNLPSPLNFCIALPCCAFMLVAYFFYTSKRKKEAAAKEAELEEASGAATLPVTPQNFDQLSVIAQRTVEGSFYQLIYRSGKLLCYRVGHELRGPDPEKIINDLSQPLPPLGKKDFSFPVSEVTNCKISSANERYHTVLKFKLDGKRYAWGILAPDEAEARKFLAILFPSLR